MEALLEAKMTREQTSLDNAPRNCSTCMLGTSMVVNGDVLCRLRGAVSKNHCCRRYKPSPFYRAALSGPETFLSCSGCKFFEPDSPDTDPVQRLMGKNLPVIGLCSLFSVRKYDGCARKACSKFIVKDTREVS
jgi:hypothetical protein